MQNLNIHEPAPVRADHAPVWPFVFEDMHKLLDQFPAAGRVLRDMEERNEWGIQKHGGPLVVDDGRRSLVDDYQELLDATVYTKKALLEGTNVLGRLVLTDIYGALIESACQIRQLIDEQYGE